MGGRCCASVLGFDWYRRGWVFYYPNPSGVVAESVNSVVLDGCGVCGLVLEVDYSSVGHVEELLDKYRPRVVVGLGLHPGASRPLYEAVAVNLRDEERSSGRQLFPGRPLTVSAPVDLFGLVGKLRGKGYDVTVSNTLGIYLCNALAYTIYYWAHRNGAGAVFIHVPPVGTLRIRLGLSSSGSVWSTGLLRGLVLDTVSLMLDFRGASSSDH